MPQGFAGRQSRLMREHMHTYNLVSQTGSCVTNYAVEICLVTLPGGQIGKCRGWAWRRVRRSSCSDGFPCISIYLAHGFLWLCLCGVRLVTGLWSLVPGTWFLVPGIYFVLEIAHQGSQWCRCRISWWPRRICPPNYQSRADWQPMTEPECCLPSAGRPLSPPPSSRQGQEPPNQPHLHSQPY